MMFANVLVFPQEYKPSLSVPLSEGEESILNNYFGKSDDRTISHTDTFTH